MQSYHIDKPWSDNRTPTHRRPYRWRRKQKISSNEHELGPLKVYDCRSGLSTQIVRIIIIDNNNFYLRLEYINPSWAGK